MEDREDIKPKNLTVQEFLTRKTAVRTMVDESIVEKILSHEKKSALTAFHNHHQVEFSGFGKFVLSQSKLRKRIERQVKILSALYQKLEKTELDWKKIAEMSEDLVYYKSKVKPDEDRPKRYSRGDKEHTLPQEGSEGANRTDTAGEVGSLQNLS